MLGYYHGNESQESTKLQYSCQVAFLNAIAGDVKFGLHGPVLTQ